MTRTATRAAIVLLLAAAATVKAAPAGAETRKEPLVDVPGYEALTSSAEAAGDDAAFAARLVEAAIREPGSAGAHLALSRLAGLDLDSSAARESLRAGVVRLLEAEASGPYLRWNRDLALRLLARLEEARGDAGAAEAARARRGTIRDWLVLGPFGSSRHAVHGRAFPIEAAQRTRVLAIDEAHPGARGSVRWQAAKVAPLADGIAPFVYLRPERGAAYALAQVRGGEAGTAAVLAIRCTGSFKAWWNGGLVADLDRSTAYLPLGVEVEVTVGGGWNRLLVKVGDPYAVLEARLVDPEGAVLPGIAVEAGERIHALDLSAAGAAPEPLATPATLLERAATAAPADPLPRAALAYVLADAGVPSEALPHAERAAEMARASAHLQVLHARIAEDARHLPETYRRNVARAADERARAADPEFGPGLERLAKRLAEEGRPEEAIRALRSLAARRPKRASLHLEVAELCREQGFESDAFTHVARHLELVPDSARGWYAQADLHGRKGDVKRELECLRKAALLDAAMPGLEERIASRLEGAGDLEAAEAMRRRLLERRPQDPSRIEAVARVVRARGDLAGASKLYLAAADLVPAEARYPRLAGEALLEAGARDDALKLLDRTLALDPAQASLRRMLERMRGVDWDFAKPYEVDLRAALATAPGQTEHPKASSICLIDLSVTRIYGRGARTDIVHQAFKILDAKGVERYHTIRIPGEILEVRTILPSGEVLEPVITDATAEILMPGLAPGSVVEYRYLEDHDDADEFQVSPGKFYFQDPSLTEPFVLSRYVVIAERGVELDPVSRNFREPEVTERGGARIYRWENRDVGRIDPEPLMPERDEILPWVEVIERRTWEDLHELCLDRWLGRTALVPELRAAAEKATEGLAGDRAKALALHRFVADHVKGDSGGLTAAQVFHERAGPRDLLLKALLEAAGVPCRPVRVGTNPDLSPPVEWERPRPDLLPGTALLIEPRDGPPAWIFRGGRFLPYGMVPLEYQGATALICSPLGGELAVVPRDDLVARATRTRLHLRMDGADARCDAEMVLPDAPGFGIKERVLTMPRAQLKSIVERQANEMFPGAKLLSFDVPDLDRPDAPFRLVFACQAPRVAVESDGLFAIKTGIPPLELTERFGGKSRREHPMLFRRAGAQVDEVEIDLGEGYDVAALPPNLLVRDRFGSYSFRVSAEGRKIRVARTVINLPDRVEAADYPRFLSACREVDAAEFRRIHLRKRAAPGSGAGGGAGGEHR